MFQYIYYKINVLLDKVLTLRERFERTEKADRGIYRKFIDKYDPSIELQETDILCCYDLIQTKGGDRQLIEIKTRWDYRYADFEDISVDERKIKCIMKSVSDNESAYLCAIFPRDEKIVLIDITGITYTEDDLVRRYANAQTISDNPYKRVKTFVPLSLRKGKDKKLNTKTFVYYYPNLSEEYTAIYKL